MKTCFSISFSMVIPRYQILIQWYHTFFVRCQDLHDTSWHVPRNLPLCCSSKFSWVFLYLDASFFGLSFSWTNSGCLIFHLESWCPAWSGQVAWICIYCFQGIVMQVILHTCDGNLIDRWFCASQPTAQVHSSLGMGGWNGFIVRLN
jgi:hypothetical protein